MLKHRITDVDEEKKRGTCSICGPNTELRMRTENGRVGWRCQIAYRASNRNRYKNATVPRRDEERRRGLDRRDSGEHARYKSDRRVARVRLLRSMVAWLDRLDAFGLSEYTGMPLEEAQMMVLEAHIMSAQLRHRADNMLPEQTLRIGA